MKTKDLLTKLNALPFVSNAYLTDCNTKVNIIDDSSNFLCCVSTDERFVIDGLTSSSFDFLEYNKKEELMQILFDYIKTPVNERVDPIDDLQEDLMEITGVKMNVEKSENFAIIDVYNPLHGCIYSYDYKNEIIQTYTNSIHSLDILITILNRLKQFKGETL